MLSSSYVGDTPVMPGQTLAAFKNATGEHYLGLFNPYFPYAAYAPEGEVEVNSAMAWSNPTFDEDVSHLAEQLGSADRSQVQRDHRQPTSGTSDIRRELVQEQRGAGVVHQRVARAAQ